MVVCEGEAGPYRPQPTSHFNTEWTGHRTGSMASLPVDGLPMTQLVGAVGLGKSRRPSSLGGDFVHSRASRVETYCEPKSVAQPLSSHSLALFRCISNSHRPQAQGWPSPPSQDGG